jgi:hypothetical protein
MLFEEWNQQAGQRRFSTSSLASKSKDMCPFLLHLDSLYMIFQAV